MIQPMISVPFPSSYWVVPRLFLAGEHPVEFSAADTLVRLTALLDAGIRTFVNLTQEQEKMESYARGLRTLAAERGIEIEVLRIPIPDRTVPPVATLRSILDLIDDSIAKAHPVFVHCFAGIGRTGTVVGCYLKRHGQAAEAGVITKISELRSQMPGGNEPSPHTPEQVEVVRRWPAGM